MKHADRLQREPGMGGIRMRTFEEIVKIMAEIELDPQSHDRDPDDYENEQDFYLENIKVDSYEEYLKNSLSDEEKSAYDILQLCKAIKNAIIESI